MPRLSANRLDNFRRALGHLSDSAFRALWPLVESAYRSGGADAAKAVLLSNGINVLQAAETAAATLGADLYDDLRPGTGFTAIVADAAESSVVTKSLKYFVGDLYKDEPDLEKFSKRLRAFTRRRVNSGARNSIVQSAERDPLKASFARVPSGVDACKFCLMLASRGFFYVSARVAGEATKFHDGCRCQIIPSWSGNPTEVEGYDPDALYEIWQELENGPAQDQ